MLIWRSHRPGNAWFHLERPPVLLPELAGHERRLAGYGVRRLQGVRQVDVEVIVWQRSTLIQDLLRELEMRHRIRPDEELEGVHVIRHLAVDAPMPEPYRSSVAASP